MNIEFLSADFSIDEGNYFWTGQFTLADPKLADQFEIDTPFTFSCGGEDFLFIVDQKSVSKNGVEPVSVTINGTSPSVVLTSPRCDLITKTWGATTAYAVVQEVIDGYPMSWEILDWPLSVNLFAVTSQAPLDIVKTLVAVVGALVETQPDGSLRVRYIFPQPVPQYSVATADRTVNEADEVFTSTEGFQSSKTYNRIRLANADVDATPADRLEFVNATAGLQGTGTVLAYPSPWRTDFVLASTLSTVVIGDSVYTEREETEVIEIKASKGAVQYPIYSIVSSFYEDDDLGGLSFDVGDTNITTLGDNLGYSVLSITYKVRTLNFPVSGPLNSTAQFLMEDIS